MKPLLFILIIILFSLQSKAQTLTQNIRGTIIDKVSQSPLPGATVVLLESDPLKGTSTDGEGKFTLQNVPVGKQGIKINFMGYKEILMRDLPLHAGKELVLTIQLEEDATLMQEVVIKAQVDKTKALNDMSTVSSRTFSVEETQKFAAAVNDPARMATSFAGVTQGDDGNNYISIRGNSPNGLLWRMEGVDIPNPNHFAGVGTSGGGISILSAQVMSNSDFSTGAFAAEYGNALSGVFDLKLRKGNDEKRENTIQIGVLGLDLASEGPFKKGYNGSYLINYRYSTLSILGQLGVPLGDGITNFQDLSFNIHLPTKKHGTFGIFGFGGLSDQNTKPKKDSLMWKEDSWYQYRSNFVANTGAVGFTHTKLFNNQSYLRTALVLSGTENAYDAEKLQTDYSNYDLEYKEAFTQSKIGLSSVYTKKFNAKSSIRTGVVLDKLNYDLEQKELDEADKLSTVLESTGETYTAQSFFQWKYMLSGKLTANIGIHYLQLFLNNSMSVEPRASMKYELNSKNNLTLGYGLHSQLQPIGVYFVKPLGVAVSPNKDLELSKAHHLVLGHDLNINSYSHIKTEIYYQHLFDLPISTDMTKTFSIINSVDGFYLDPLTNKGLGRNYGLELTYERFLHKSLYYLFSGSLFQSQYKASNGKWYDTRFNTNYASSFTLGKEWDISKNNSSKMFGFNMKAIYSGGQRFTPIDLTSSILNDETQYITAETYTKQNPDYWRLDLRVSLKRNFRNMTSIWALDIQNSTNRKNVGGQYFDSNTGAVKYWYQTPLIPILSYKLEF